MKDPRATRAALAAAVIARMSHAPVAHIPRLKLNDRRELREEPGRVFAKQRAHLVAYSDALLNASPEDLAEHAYGFALQQKELERRWKYAFPLPKEQADPSEALRVMGDAELVRMAREIGVLGDGQDADSASGVQG